MIVIHKNDFCTYLSDWFNRLQMIRLNLQIQAKRTLGTKPKPFQALGDNTYELCLMLFYLDAKMRRLEESSPNQIDLISYSEARVFLKSVYLFFRILLDTVAAVIEYFYKENEKITLPPSFRKLISKQKAGQLPDELSRALNQSLSWFPDFKSRREDLVHHYQSFLILFQKDPRGNIALDHTYLNPSDIPNGETLGNIRDYVGFLLKSYQGLVDALLDLFDLKFQDWYGIIGGYKSRTETIMEDISAYVLWWAARYGNYQHADLRISDEECKT
jgi:hypothetical protein